MNEIDLYRRVVGDCDEALREAFIKRMNIADKIAELKLKNGQDITTGQIDEIHVQKVIHDVPVELRPMALSLWRSLARMNRGRQYAYFNNKSRNITLDFEKYLSKELIVDSIVCSSDIFDEVKNTFKNNIITFNTQAEVLRSISNGEYKVGVIKTNGFYDTSWLYSEILDKNIYINRFEILEDGSMLALLSDRLVLDDRNIIITAAFSISMNQPGDMAQKVSIFFEAGLNIEYLAVKTQNIDVDDSRNINIVFAELSGSSLSNPSLRAAFLQLEHECEFFKIIGYRNSVL